VGTNRLSSNQVQAIVHLVASSVEGLAPEDVTLADANGNVLAAPGQDSSAASSTRNEQTKAYEDTLAASLQDMVQKVTGDGHAVVKVKAELDFDKKSTTTETYADAAKATPIAQKSTKETFTGNGGSAATGVLGANGAAAAAASTTTNGATATGATSSYTKEDSQSDFAVGKVVETVSATPGTVTRLSVAVLLDGRRKVNAASLRKLVSAAAGLQTARGDKLEVGQLPFDQTGQKEAATQLALASQTEQKKAMFDMVKSGLLALLALMSVFFAWRGAKKSAGTRTVDPIPLDSLPRPRQLALLAGEDDEDDDEDDRPRRSRRGGSNDDDDEDGPLALPADVEPRPDIAALIEKQPADVANMLREWLGDRRN
jgi:flagellar M-ring protein FliF